MAFMHGRLTFVSLNGVDLSAFTNSTAFNDASDMGDVTCYGADRKGYAYGLGDGTVTIGGVSDNGGAGPRAVLKPLKASRSTTEFIFRPDGTGIGKIQSRVNVTIKSFNESSPVAEFCTWTAELQMTGALTETAQV